MDFDFNEDYFQWDVNDDSLFAEEDDDFLALLNNPIPYDPAAFATGPSAAYSSSYASAAVPAVGGGGGLPAGAALPGGAVYHTTHPAAQQHAAVAAVAAAAKRKMVVSEHDKRRHYAKMYAEAFNSGDAKQLRAFLDAYCTLDCVVIQRSVVRDNLFIPKYVEISGLEAIHAFWAQTFLSIPDCLIVMLQTKLRIRNHRPGENTATLLSSSSLSTTSQGVLCSVDPVGPVGAAGIAAGGGAASVQEASSIVSSFSFTGTKIYTMAMEGAVLHPHCAVSETESDTSPTAATTTAVAARTQRGRGSGSGGSGGGGAAGDAAVSLSRVSSSGSSVRERESNGRKRALPAEWSSQQTAESASQTAESVAGGNADRYNIFLHPPRRFSTLAGTPYGGNASHYTHSNTHSAKTKNSGNNTVNSGLNSAQHAMVAATAGGGVTKIADFVSISAKTTYKPGQLTEREGVINFLGTLTMSLDENNKIAKFEFLYSNFD